jgi:hypothetical protein
VKDGTDKPISRLVTPNIFCRSCESPLVQALDWDQEDESSWRVRLWCPECSFEQVANLDRPQLLYLSLAVEEGFVWVLEGLSELDGLPAAAGSLDFAYRAQTDRIRLAGR